MTPLYSLPAIFLLLSHKDEVIEEILELLICGIDTKLLETILHEILKPREVKNTNCAALIQSGIKTMNLCVLCNLWLN